MNRMNTDKTQAWLQYFPLPQGFEAGLPQADREGIRRSVQTAFDDIEAGRFEEYDSEGLRSLVKNWCLGP